MNNDSAFWAGLRAALNILDRHRGHDIVRVLIHQICATYAIEDSPGMFHVEYLHPPEDHPVLGKSHPELTLRMGPATSAVSEELSPAPASPPSGDCPLGSKQEQVEALAAQSLKERRPLDVLDQLAALWQEILKLRSKVDDLEKLTSTGSPWRSIEALIPRVKTLEEQRGRWTGLEESLAKLQTQLVQHLDRHLELYDSSHRQSQTPQSTPPPEDPQRPVFELAHGYSLPDSLSKVRGVTLLRVAGKWVVSW